VQCARTRRIGARPRSLCAPGEGEAGVSTFEVFAFPRVRAFVGKSPRTLILVRIAIGTRP